MDLVKYGNKRGRRIRKDPRISSFSNWVTGGIIIWPQDYKDREFTKMYSV